MKNMAAEAPDPLTQSIALAPNAQAIATAQQSTAQQSTAQVTTASSVGDPLLTMTDESPIAGVTLELYVSISRSLADVGFDASKAPELAAKHGISPTAWEAAIVGWNARMQAQPAIAQRFNVLYTKA
ncbi:MAG: hypothetical protein ABIQ39_06570 [Ilumatobacteraceae bacterium]